MTLDIPAGATVQIFIGSQHPVPLLAPSQAVAELPAPVAAPRRRRPLLTGGALAALALVAFLAGQGTARHAGLQLATNAEAVPASNPPAGSRQGAGQPEVGTPASYPSHLPVPASPQAAAPQGIDAPTSGPQAFARQLQQPPSITPPPGSPPAGTQPQGNPFGLEN